MEKEESWEESLLRQIEDDEYVMEASDLRDALRKCVKLGEVKSMVMESLRGNEEDAYSLSRKIWNGCERLGLVAEHEEAMRAEDE